MAKETGESLTKTKNRAKKILEFLKEAYPNSRCSLDFTTVHQLLVATILSAQCTDERVNLVTPELFQKYPTVKAFAEADLRELEEAVHSTGFYANKAKSIKKSARQLVEQYGGEMPRTIDDLVKLGGVGRKTASVILGAGFGIAEGIVVDTHVGRISRLLGFTEQEDPVKVERDLMQIIPHEDWIVYSHMLIDHGRAVCKARKPVCGSCTLAKLCPSANTPS